MGALTENQFRRAFETDFFDLVSTKANNAINKRLQRTQGVAKLFFTTGLKLRHRHSTQGHSDEVDAAVLLKTNDKTYMLGLICAKSSLKELKKHAPYQGIAYLLKLIHPTFRQDVCLSKFFSVEISQLT